MLHTTFDTLFRSKNGSVVIWQNPNIPLWIWIISSLLKLLVEPGAAETGLQRIAQTSLFTWAYLEMRSGESIFRRVLGVVILIFTVYGFFTK